MKILILTVRILFGLLIIWGGVMHFTVNVADYQSDFINALAATGYLWQIIGLLLIMTGISIISGYFVPLALVILAPISFNICNFHFSQKDVAGWVIGSIVASCTIFLFWAYRESYRELLKS
jgi:putative oxidoreductase